jgi:hypothetical protein
VFNQTLRGSAEALSACLVKWFPLFLMDAAFWYTRASPSHHLDLWLLLAPHSAGAFQLPHPRPALASHPPIARRSHWLFVLPTVVLHSYNTLCVFCILVCNYLMLIGLFFASTILEVQKQCSDPTLCILLLVSVANRSCGRHC